MSLTRAERRQFRASVPAAGCHGVDVTAAGADSWTGRYPCWAESPNQARRRIVSAGFHRRQVQARWTPEQPPPEGLPSGGEAAARELERIRERRR